MSADIEQGIGRFPRPARLHSPSEFQSVFSQGRRLNTALFRLHAHLSGSREVQGAEDEGARPPAAKKSKANPSARLGISVPKRVAAHAVERNRIRRIARESFRHIRLRLPPGDYVLLAQRAAAGATATALRDSLSTLWPRAAALKPEGVAPTMPIPAAKQADTAPPISVVDPPPMNP